MIDVLNIAQNVAFPIIVSVILMYYIKHVQDKYVDRMIDTMNTAIENNTKALNKLHGALMQRRAEDRE